MNWRLRGASAEPLNLLLDLIQFHTFTRNHRIGSSLLLTRIEQNGDARHHEENFENDASFASVRMRTAVRLFRGDANVIAFLHDLFFSTRYGV